MPKIKTSSNDEKHPYMRPEKWISELVFWNTPMHVKASYEDFHARMINEAQRKNKT